MICWTNTATELPYSDCYGQMVIQWWWSYNTTVSIFINLVVYFCFYCIESYNVTVKIMITVGTLESWYTTTVCVQRTIERLVYSLWGENTYCAMLILSVSLSGAKNTGDVSTQSTNSIHVRRVSIVDRVSDRVSEWVTEWQSDTLIPHGLVSNRQRRYLPVKEEIGI